MKKKIVLLPVLMLGMLLTSCGEGPLLNADGKVHKLENGVIVAGDDELLEVAFNMASKEKVLVRGLEKEVWETQEVTVSTQYQRISNEKNEYRFFTERKTVNQIYNEKTKELEKVESGAVLDSTFVVKSVVKMSFSLLEEDETADEYYRGYADASEVIPLENADEENAVQDFYRLTDVEEVEQTWHYSMVEYEMTIEEKLYVYALKDVAIYVPAENYSDLEGVSMVGLNSFFVETEDGVVSEITLNEENHDEYVTGAKTLIFESSMTAPAAYFEGGE